MNTTMISEHDGRTGPDAAVSAASASCAPGQAVSVGSSAAVAAPVRVQAHGAVVKHLGSWTGERAFDVRANRGVAVLDLRSPAIPAGDIRVDVDLDHGVLKLLVPDDAVVDSWELRREGRGKVKDAAAPPTSVAPAASAEPSDSDADADADASSSPGARRVVLVGRLRDAEVRVRRSGVAVLTAMCSREYFADLRRAHREGTMPTVADPAGEY